MSWLIWSQVMAKRKRNGYIALSALLRDASLKFAEFASTPIPRRMLVFGAGDMARQLSLGADAGRKRRWLALWALLRDTAVRQVPSGIWRTTQR